MKAEHIRQLERVPWQIAATLTFKNASWKLHPYAGGGDAGRLIYATFVRNAAIHFGLGVAGVSVFVGETAGIRPHAHVLLIGKNADGKTLAEASLARLEAFWPFGDAKARRVYDVEGAVDYHVAKHVREGGEVNYHGLQQLNRWFKA